MSQLHSEAHLLRAELDQELDSLAQVVRSYCQRRRQTEADLPAKPVSESKPAPEVSVSQDPDRPFRGPRTQIEAEDIGLMAWIRQLMRRLK